MVSVITCGLDENEVFNVPLDSVEFIEPPKDKTTFPLKVLRGVATMQLYMCGRCGAMVAGYSDATTLHAPRSCPHCGARITCGGDV